MPELPEVETIRRSLAPLLEGRVLVAARGEAVAPPGPGRTKTPVPPGADPRYVGIDDALGRTVRELGRRGKYLVADLGDRELIVHLGMTGKLGVSEADQVPERHLRLAFRLDDGRVLHYRDQRRFGFIYVVAPGDYALTPTLARMGPEPLLPAFDRKAFRAAMAAAQVVKPLLLTQRVVAGLGNIYVDEALFRAGIHPARGHLTAAEADRLHAAIRDVLQDGIANRGTTLRDYVDGRGDPGDNQHHLRVFDREGEPCGVCGSPVRKVRLQNRGTHFCPTCQPERRARAARSPGGN